MDGDLKIIMRGNSILETQYYLLYKEGDSYVLDNQLFTDNNYIVRTLIFEISDINGIVETSYNGKTMTNNYKIRR